MIVSTLKDNGHDPYCTFLEDDSFQDKHKKNMLIHAFKKIDTSEVFLAIVRSERRSEGMLIEVGYALSKKKKFILAINMEVKNTYLRDLADEVIEFESFKSLISKLENSIK